MRILYMKTKMFDLTQLLRFKIQWILISVLDLNYNFVFLFPSEEDGGRSSLTNFVRHIRMSMYAAAVDLHNEIWKQSFAIYKIGG